MLVSPDNVSRAKENRQVKTVRGEWLSAEESGKRASFPLEA